MNKILMTALIAASAMASPAVAQVADGSFETQGAASPGSYCYFQAAQYGPACASGAWTGGGVTSGFQNETNTAWPGSPSPAGSFYAFIQSGYGAAGSISQAITLAAGTYRLSWLDAGRPGGNGDQAYNVILGATQIGAGQTTSGQLFAARSAGLFTVGAGTYNLTFQALNSGGDNAAFIDGVNVAAVPEPASWALMIGGFGLVGVAMRRRAKPRSTLTFA